MRWLILTICRLIVLLTMKRRISGMERVPAEGGVLIVSNHLGLIDPLALGIDLPRPFSILAKVEMFSWPIIGPAARKMDAIPVRRGQSDREAVRLVLEHLEAGHAVLMFPEGTYPKGKRGMIKAQPGAALLALKSKATILPVAITGSEHIWNPRELPWNLFRRWPVRVTVGEPYQPTLSPKISQKQALVLATDEMMQRVAALLPTDYQGYYRPALPTGEPAPTELVTLAPDEPGTSLS
ncbi:MAG TPA: lysophospholipid acyltransferase family protein [Ktedonobacterales bacterium]|jgi:1-acyl-sn-glycerol-3-phosphate acyltransferase